MATANSKRVLIAALDWGLGHATRCVPVVTEFQALGYAVQIATSGGALTLLKAEFPQVKFHEITPYQAKYSSILPFAVKMLVQLPKFLLAIRKEHKEIASIIEQEKIDFVISDNRYGCWSKEVPCVFIGHQMNLLNTALSPVVNYFHRRAIRNFSEVWIPDHAGENSLAGELTSTPLKAKYVGLLSRMRWSESERRYEIMAIVSGPEPQRSIFEKIVVRELRHSGKKCLVVLGQLERTGETKLGEIRIVNHLVAKDMNKAMLESDIIISRSGYSTVMDLAVLGKKAIFVPTPGQPEQEYLAKRLMKKKIAFTTGQDEFDLSEALRESSAFTGFKPAERNMQLRQVIEELCNETYQKF